MTALVDPKVVPTLPTFPTATTAPPTKKQGNVPVNQFESIHKSQAVSNVGNVTPYLTIRPELSTAPTTPVHVPSVYTDTPLVTTRKNANLIVGDWTVRNEESVHQNGIEFTNIHKLPDITAPEVPQHSAFEHNNVQKTVSKGNIAENVHPRSTETTIAYVPHAVTGVNTSQNLTTTTTRSPPGKYSNPYNVLPSIQPTKSLSFGSLIEKNKSLFPGSKTAMTNQASSKKNTLSKLLTKMVGANVTVMDFLEFHDYLHKHSHQPNATPRSTTFSPLNHMLQDKIIAELIKRLTGGNVIVIDKKHFYPVDKHQTTLENIATVGGTSEVHQLFPPLEKPASPIMLPTVPSIAEVNQSSVPVAISGVSKLPNSNAIVSNKTVQNTTMTLAQNKTKHNESKTSTAAMPADEITSPASALNVTVVSSTGFDNSTASWPTDTTTPMFGSSTMDPDAAADLLEAQEEAASLAAELAENAEGTSPP